MVTMKDIAQKAGVSYAAVSRVLNGHHGRIPATTRQRIIDAAEEMGYQRNQLAKAMARGEQIPMFGYLVASPRYEPYWNTIISATEEADTLGFSMKVMSSTEATLLEQIRRCIGLRLGGLLIRVDGDKTVALEEAKRANVPVVVIDEGISVPYGTVVSADDAPGCGQALDHLVKLGHHRIAFITSGFPDRQKGDTDIGIQREQLFLEQMAQHQLTVPAGYIVGEATQVYSFQQEFTIDDKDVRLAVRSLLAHTQGPPTAIVCWRDETALFAIAECRRQGVRVPEDVSIIGFSDLTSASTFDPPLSTIRAPWKAMGELAIQVLADSFYGRTERPATSHRVPSSFIARASTGIVSPR